jgi:hypothetical protein
MKMDYFPIPRWQGSAIYVLLCKSKFLLWNARLKLQICDSERKWLSQNLRQPLNMAQLKLG